MESDLNLLAFMYIKSLSSILYFRQEKRKWTPGSIIDAPPHDKT